MLETIKQTADYLASKISEIPNTAIILGTGLGELAREIEDREETLRILDKIEKIGEENVRESFNDLGIDKDSQDKIFILIEDISNEEVIEKLDL